MSQHHIDRMTADRLWSEWQADAERIRKDTVELFSFRRQFREIQEIFAGNAHLQAVGGHVWDWIRRAYVWTVLARLRHEAVCEGNGVSLRQLLEEIERRPDVVTRGRVLSRVSERDMRLQRALDENFSITWMQSSDIRVEPCWSDTIHASVVASDRRELIAATERLVEYASRTVAHRSRVAPDELKVLEVDTVFDVIDRALRKYLVLITGVSWPGFESTPLFNTIEPFKFPWFDPFYRAWTAISPEVKRAAGLSDLGENDS